ncbi:hypothetical protein HBE99_02735 [Mycobacteroides chelonae]|nr:hypothetical protein HBE99_02735 [Mycobacteroides chelonae]
MKWIEDSRVLELTQRNINALRDKLDDPLSARTLGSGCGRVMVRATETVTAEKAIAAAVEGVITVTRKQLVELLEGETVTVDSITVVPVPDAAHYSHRPAGDVYMPSSGELRSGINAMVRAGRSEPERITISAATMFELRPQMLQLLADGWTMTRMDKPIAEGFGENVTAWFEREAR